MIRREYAKCIQSNLKCKLSIIKGRSTRFLFAIGNQHTPSIVEAKPDLCASLAPHIKTTPANAIKISNLPKP